MTSVRRAALLLCLALPACSAKKDAAPSTAPRGQLAALLQQHDGANCQFNNVADSTRASRPPYTQCVSGDGDASEIADLDSDSTVIRIANTWTIAPASRESEFSRAETDIIARFGDPRRCGEFKREWRQGDSVHIVLQIAPASVVGTEFDTGPWRMNRIGRLGEIIPAAWAC